LHIHKAILAVDDDLDIVSIIKLSLRRYGFNVFAFTDPFLALEHFKLNLNDYDLVLSDVRMPGMTGFEFIVKVREMQPNIKVLLMSAFEINDSGFSKALPRNTKINGYVQKPVSPKELIKIIEKCLDEEEKH
jgi:CheY-like chemotaxis protein